MAADPVTAYARAVTSGKQLAGRLVPLACQRHLDDLETGTARRIHFDAKAAARAIAFFPELLHLSEGEHAGVPFTLAPRQQFIVGSLFGWKAQDGFRRFRTAYIETAVGKWQAVSRDG
jgi:phage terminase large subunit-like protein